MRPESPAAYRPTLIERLGLQRWLSQPTRMIARHVERRPFKSLLTVGGIAAACGVIMVSNFQADAIHYMIDVQYAMSERQDLSVIFNEPSSHHALYSLAGLEGVEQVEGIRTVPARLRFEHRSYLGSLQGLEPDGRLRRLLNAQLDRVSLPAEGVVLTDYLAELLNIRPGELLTVEVKDAVTILVNLPAGQVAVGI